jgi:hypothetical protein
MIRSRRLIVIAALVAFATALLVWVLPRKAVIELQVVNGTSHTISDVHITHRFAGLEYIPSLQIGQRATMRLSSSRGSGMRVSYRLGSELKVSEADVYTGSRETEVVTIRITDDGLECEAAPNSPLKKSG